MCVLGTRGPCNEGHIFKTKVDKTGNKESLHAECSCQSGYVLWPENGKCYQPFTRGPCRSGQMLEVNYTQVIKQLPTKNHKSDLAFHLSGKN